VADQRKNKPKGGLNNPGSIPWRAGARWQNGQGKAEHHEADGTQLQRAEIFTLKQP
jgi:hypothetical protein